MALADFQGYPWPQWAKLLKKFGNFVKNPTFGNFSHEFPKNELERNYPHSYSAKLDTQGPFSTRNFGFL